MPEPGSRVTLHAPREPHDGLSVIVTTITPDWFAWVAPGVMHPRARMGWEWRGRSLWSEVAEAEVGARTRGAVLVAKLNGMTGDVCPSCGGANMVRSGSCATCLDCGGTSGCS